MTMNLPSKKTSFDQLIFSSKSKSKPQTNKSKFDYQKQYLKASKAVVNQQRR